MSKFKFKTEIAHDTSAHSTLSETMALDKDYVVISFHTEFGT